MDSAQLYRDRADHLRRLASAERDVTLRQQLTYLAIRFEEFAEELEARQQDAMPLAADGDDKSRSF